ncbi:hypothetical protein C7I85_07100 [Mesorhizobium soli]|uniref:Uncharacterized protein n=1 Tax=Pseudaminobacter soli (ex Li et al. 2025) TaxID=1295366 RepID=A0A2P7SHZ2_9HYPH|nr:hypothetical protein C7I85_07100 [Mesorhizobium soli]
MVKMQFTFVYSVCGGQIPYDQGHNVASQVFTCCDRPNEVSLRRTSYRPRGSRLALRASALRYGSGRSSFEKPNLWLFARSAHHSSPSP